MVSGEAASSPVIFEPGVGSAYGNGWTRLWKNFLELFLILIITLVIGMISSIPQWVASQNPVSGLFTFIINVLVTGPIGYGVYYVYLRAARGEKPEIQDMFAAFGNYWNAVLAGLLVGVIVVIGFVLLIVPGIIFACKLAFTPYLVVDRKMDVIDAVKESWNMTRGHAGQVFLIGLLAIPIGILGIICFGVGVIIAGMWITCAFASLYHAVSLKHGSSVQQEPLQQGPVSA